MSVFESDDSLELCDLGEEEEKEGYIGIGSDDEENVNPNVENKKITKGSNSQKGRIESQSTRRSGRSRVSST